MPTYSAEPMEGQEISFVRGQVRGVNIGKRISEPVALAIAEYLNYVLETIGLPQWRVHLYDDPPDKPEMSAMMNTRTDTYDAGVWLGDKFFDDNEMQGDLRTSVLIHEMLHLHFDQAWNFVGDTWDRAFGTEARELADRTFKEFMELGVDTLAHKLVEILPRKFELPKKSET